MHSNILGYKKQKKNTKHIIKPIIYKQNFSTFNSWKVTIFGKSKNLMEKKLALTWQKDFIYLSFENYEAKFGNFNLNLKCRS